MDLPACCLHKKVGPTPQHIHPLYPPPDQIIFFQEIVSFSTNTAYEPNKFAPSGFIFIGKNACNFILF
jgi:hypothetical protein